MPEVRSGGAGAGGDDSSAVMDDAKLMKGFLTHCHNRWLRNA
jgi:hypothetical protein